MSKILLLSATDLEHSQTEIHGIPIHITGIGNFFWVLITLIIKLIIKYITDNGKSKIDQNDIFWLSQNFGFLNFIFK